MTPRTEPETRIVESVLERLERLAAAATPGEWASDEGRPYNSGLDPIDEGECPSFSIPSPDRHSGREWWTHSVSSDDPVADAAYIAAASPDVVLALVAAVRAAEELEAALFEEPADNMFGAPLMAEWERRRNRAEDDLRAALQALQAAPEREPGT